MADAYSAIDGFNNAGTLAVLSPQPATPDLVETEVEFFGNSHAENVGFEHTELVWSTISYAEHAALLTALGVSATVASNDETMRLRRYDGWFNVNATVNYLRGERRVAWGVEDFRVTVLIRELL